MENSVISVVKFSIVKSKSSSDHVPKQLGMVEIRCDARYETVQLLE
jgi:hypothetical protein